MAASNTERAGVGAGAAVPVLLRYLAVPLLFGVGVVHLYEYVADHYRVIPIIGDLFIANFATAVVLGLVLAAPPRSLRFLGSLPVVRSVPFAGRAPHVLVAIAAILFLLGTIAGLIVSEQATLFGFHEYGYRATVWLALGLEAAAVLVLAAFAALEARRVSGR
ncbi:hypothetical protein [Actinomadura harenae]|uniref:Uncharacterized protein n=1 Tax=Actinomadura harenae TaxID=2483351 RepID=A0A3M2LFC2_9ACTN|nr:hypothetical protein [Actinomadura harenae]RMI36094.1 hypothetical protein EBO15_39570 [Actinomadura harenae]